VLRQEVQLHVGVENRLCDYNDAIKENYLTRGSLHLNYPKTGMAEE
jgi:hypothetical protein